VVSVRNVLLERLLVGETLLGVWLVSGSLLLGQTIVAEGVADYVCVDAQHGVISEELMMGLMPMGSSWGCGTLVRVAENSAYRVGRALDLGAMGVVVPLVESSEATRRAVAACRLGAGGTRSFGPLLAGATLGARTPAELGEVACFVMAESREAVARSEELAEVAGLTGIYVGPWDLAVSLGIEPGRLDDVRLMESVLRVRDVCVSRGIVPGIQCNSVEAAKRYVDEGFRLVTVGTDVQLALGAVRASVSRVRSA